MSRVRKKKEKRILSKLTQLTRKYRSDARSWWPKFVFHYTDLQNISSILQTGFLFSRNEAIHRNCLRADVASQSVLKTTPDKFKDYVRLYFRPKTPTQFCNEGIRPPEKLYYGAHCPIPVMLLFDAQDVLTRYTTRFSNGSLARRSPIDIGGKASFFENLPFRDIYHNSSLREDEKRLIVARRHAEVIVPNRLDLKSLRYIWCRSQAEKETLVSLLSHDQLTKWAHNIFHGKKYDLFFCRWSYVDRADVANTGVKFNFNRNTITPGPFDLKCRIIDHDTGRDSQAFKKSFMVRDKIRQRFNRCLENYTVELYMDEILVYRTSYQQTDDVF